MSMCLYWDNLANMLPVCWENVVLIGWLWISFWDLFVMILRFEFKIHFMRLSTMASTLTKFYLTVLTELVRNSKSANYQISYFLLVINVIKKNRPPVFIFDTYGQHVLTVGGHQSWLHGNRTLDYRTIFSATHHLVRSTTQACSSDDKTVLIF